AAAKKFLAALDDSQRAKAVLDFNSGKKAAWSNLPVSNVPRNGVRTGDLSKTQHDAAMELLASVLSKDGYQKVIDIMLADEELASGKGKDKGKDKGKGGDKGGKGKGGGKGGGKGSFGIDNYFLAI